MPDGLPIFLPDTLPGEQVRVSQAESRGAFWTGHATVELASPIRRPAPCRHFGVCGGCTLQHLPDELYRAWKIDRLREALPWIDDAVLQPLHVTSALQRRRMDLAVAKHRGVVTIGLHQRRRNEIIDMQDCWVLHPALFALVAGLRDMLRRVQGLRHTGSVLANLLDNGVDMLIRTDAQWQTDDRRHLIDFARRHRLARLCIASLNGAPEPVAQFDMPMLMMDGAPLHPPPGAFLQASGEGEAAIVQAVLDGLNRSPAPKSGKAKVIELYAGCGTLSIPMSRIRRVQAYEGDPGAVNALQKAAAGRPIQVVQRDLARQPLQMRELDTAETIVLDPPWAGDARQIAEIGRSAMRRVIYVSCNPGALSREAVILRDAGFRISSATPIDQFLWSAHLESVVVFDRDQTGRRAGRC